MKKYFQDIIFLGLFVLMVGVFFYPTITQGKLPVPTDTLIGLYHPWRDLYSQTNPRGVPFKNFLITDPVRQQIPWRKAVIDQWKAGQIPVWNPFNFSGTPLIANIQSAAFYPFNILFFLFSFPIAWTILVIIQPLLAGVFLYLYLRNLKLSGLACFWGAVIWAFSGFSIAWLTWGTMLQTLMWMPLILLSVDKLFHRLKLIWLSIFTTGLVMQFLAGHIQISFYVMALCAIYVWWRFRQLPKENRLAAQKVVTWLTIGLIIGIILTSVQWLPMVGFISQTSRMREIGNWQKEGWFLPWQHLVQFVAPDFFGNPSTLNYWGIWNYGEFIGYIGSGTLLFVFLGVFKFKDKLVLFWAKTLMVCLVFILPNPISKLFYQLQIPLLGVLQPTRLLSIIDFALVILAAYGFNYFLTKQKKIEFQPILVMGAVLVGLWFLVIAKNNLPLSDELKINLTISQRNLILPSLIFLLVAILTRISARKIGPYLIIVMVIFDLFRFGWKFTPFTPREYFFPKTKVIEFLQSQQKPFRVMSLDKSILPANVNAYYGIESIEGYDPLYSRRYEQFFAALARNEPDIRAPYGFNRIIDSQNFRSPLVDILNLRYVLSIREISDPRLREVFREGETRIYENLDYLPRAYLALETAKADSDLSVINKLYASGQSRLAISQSDLSILDIPLQLSESVEILSYSGEELKLVVQTENNRILVISQTYSPNWKAELDGKPITIHQVNYIFQGLIVPVGSHQITLKYQLFP